MEYESGQMWFYFDSEHEVPYSYITEPKCDNDILLNAQYEYIVKKDKLAFSVLWVKFRTLCYKALYKILYEKHIHLSQEDIDDAAEDAAEYTMRRYEKQRRLGGKDYIIHNFPSAARFSVMHALWSPSARDRFSDICDKAAGLTIKDAGQIEGVEKVLEVIHERQSKEETE